MKFPRYKTRKLPRPVMGVYDDSNQYVRLHLKKDLTHTDLAEFRAALRKAGLESNHNLNRQSVHVFMDDGK